MGLWDDVSFYVLCHFAGPAHGIVDIVASQFRAWETIAEPAEQADDHQYQKYPEEAYHHSTWAFNSDYSDILVIHTLAVHPDYQKCGVGKELINFAIQYGKEENMKSIRLDVFEKNIPAINLYEKSGFHYVDTVDLGLGKYGLDKFRLYEILLKFIHRSKKN